MPFPVSKSTTWKFFTDDYFTLWPGDVIWMGTDGASPDLKAGDVVEIEISGIGTLRNRFVAETPPAHQR